MRIAVAPFLTRASQQTDLYILEANAHKSENDGAVLNKRARIYREGETGTVHQDGILKIEINIILYLYHFGNKTYGN